MAGVNEWLIAEFTTADTLNNLCHERMNTVAAYRMADRAGNAPVLKACELSMNLLIAARTPLTKAQYKYIIERALKETLQDA